MKVIFLGTGNTLGGFSRPKRSMLVYEAGEFILVDCGCGAVQRMLTKSISSSIINVFLHTIMLIIMEVL